MFIIYLFCWIHPQIAIFAEGTRLTNEKLQASIDHAKNTGLPVLHHHLLPRPRGFAITAHHLKNKSESINTSTYL
jgi:lysophosphatidic acid acyltransferase/lysophosphatidylinositol acyltransferase